MPIYEYECAGCGHRLEAIQKVTEGPLRECPTCGKPRLKRLVSAAGFQLKGTGWYATDFKNSGRKPAAAEKSSGGEKSSGDGDKSSGSGESGAAKDTHGCGGGACACAS